MKIEKLEDVDVLEAEEGKCLVRKRDLEMDMINLNEPLFTVWLANTETPDDWTEIDLPQENEETNDNTEGDE